MVHKNELFYSSLLCDTVQRFCWQALDFQGIEDSTCISFQILWFHIPPSQSWVTSEEALTSFNAVLTLVTGQLQIAFSSVPETFVTP